MNRKEQKFKTVSFQSTSDVTRSLWSYCWISVVFIRAPTQSRICHMVVWQCQASLAVGVEPCASNIKLNPNMNCFKLFFELNQELKRAKCPGPAPRGGIPGPCPRNDCLCLPKQKMCFPSKRGLCPEEIKRLPATGVQIEAFDSQIRVYRPRIGDQELFLCDFCTHTGFHKTFGQRPFFFLVFT